MEREHHEKTEQHEKTPRTPKKATEHAMEQTAIDPGEMLEMVKDYARENPHVALGAAAAVGFVLGGGLTPRILMAAGVFFGKRYMNEALKGALGGALEGFEVREG